MNINKLLFSVVVIAGCTSLSDVQAWWFSSKSDKEVKAESFQECKKRCEKRCEDCSKCTWSGEYTVVDCTELCVQDECMKGPRVKKGEGVKK